jgi:hypothetical protein
MRRILDALIHSNSRPAINIALTGLLQRTAATRIAEFLASFLFNLFLVKKVQTEEKQKVYNKKGSNGNAIEHLMAETLTRVLKYGERKCCMLTKWRRTSPPCLVNI